MENCHFLVYSKGFVINLLTFSFASPFEYLSPWSSDIYKGCAEMNVLGGLSREGFLSKVLS
jgi:hypothetical protein